MSNIEVGYITGDGIGKDIMPVVINIVNSAVEKVYFEQKKIIFREIMVGEIAIARGFAALSEEALQKIRNYKICLKGPLTTPVGSGFRSLNVAIRQRLELYACIRPVKHYSCVPSPVKRPDKLDIVIFRENSEDLYLGVEFKAGSKESEQIRSFLGAVYGKHLARNCGIGIKPISLEASKRIVRSAINYALLKKRKSVTIVHKGNIMKFTEGAFKNWAYQVAIEEFRNEVVLESEINAGVDPRERLVIKDRIADSMFQQLLLRPEEYDVIVTMNLNGDYLSDAAAAQVGGLGMAPGANINYEKKLAVFEATHGTAPKYAGMDKVNPSSFLLSAVMMLEYIEWYEAADLIVRALEKTIDQKRVTYDLARQMNGAELVSCSEFGKAIVENMRS
jgi:isocitrate dehydrogenase